MFSGIVERMGKIEELDCSRKWGRLVISAEGWEQPPRIGDSIAVQGICLTLTSTDGSRLGFDILRETYECTSLGEKSVGDKLNLERSLAWGQPLGGHIVVGHVDGIGRVDEVARSGRDWTYRISCSPEIMDGLVYKGSIGVDGVSLTVADLGENDFEVCIIPYTWEVTSFGGLKPGDAVNLEVDLLSKYVRRLLERGRVLPGVTWENLRREGLIDEQPPSTAEEQD